MVINHGKIFLQRVGLFLAVLALFLLGSFIVMTWGVATLFVLIFLFCCVSFVTKD